MSIDLSRRHFAATTVGLGAAIALGVPSLSSAQPVLPQLRILCGAPPGSIPDSVARQFGEQLKGRYATTVIVENKVGAAGRLGVQALKQSTPDGATMLLAQGAIATTYPYLYEKLGYDPIADLQPVSMAGEMTLGLAVGPAVPASVRTVPEFLEWCRANPKLVNFGSPGSGTYNHLVGAMLFRKADVAWQHVAYGGGPAALVDLMSGQIAALVLPEGLLRQHKATGRLRVLATTGPQRSVALPDVATLAEHGYLDLVVREWFAFFMPVPVSPAVVDSGSQAIRQAVARSELVAAFSDLAMTPVGSTPAALVSRIAAEQRYWEPVIRSANIRID